MRKRSILPGLEGPPSDGGQATLSQEVSLSTTGSETVLAPICRWAGPTRLVSVAGGKPIIDATAFDAVAGYASTFIRLSYRAGGVAFEDRYIWNAQGWTRTLVANQVSVAVELVRSTATDGQTLRMAAGITEQGYGRDSVSLLMAGNTGLGSAPQVQLMPAGMREFRVWELSMPGTWDIGILNASGTFSAAEAGIAGSDLADWRPWPTHLTAIRYNPDAADPGPAPAMVQARGS